MEQEMKNKIVENLNLEKFIQVENYRTVKTSNGVMPLRTYKVFVVSEGKFKGLWAEGTSEISALTLLNNFIYERISRETA